MRFSFKEVSNATHSAVLRLTTTVLTLAFGIVGARLLGTETFGAYVSLFAVAGLLTVATSVGLPALLQREIAASRGSGDRRALKPLVQGLAAINGALALALAVSILAGAKAIAVVLVFCLSGNAAGMLGSLFRAHERVLLAGWIGNVLRPTVALVALVALAFISAPTELLPLFAQVIGAVAAVGAFLALWRGEPLSSSRRALRAAWWSERHAPIMRAGLLLAGTQVLINLTTQVDILILTVMANPEDVAHYYAAVRAAMVINFFFGASGLLAEPALTRLHAAAQRAEVQQLATRTALTGAVVTLAAAGVAAVVAPFYLGLYGPDFSVAFPSFCVFAAGLAVRSLFGPAAPLLRATRSDGALLVVTAAALALNALLTAALIPFFGILGAAIGSGLQFAVYGWLLAGTLWRRRAIRSDVFALVGATGRASRARLADASDGAP